MVVSKKPIKWDVKRGNAVYRSGHTKIIKKWIKDGTVKKGEIFLCREGMNDWQRLEELNEFKGLFKKTRLRHKLQKEGRKEGRILLVDDDKDIVQIFSAILEKRGYKIFSCYDGSTALKQVIKIKPKIVLLDYELPDMNGLKVLDKLLQITHSPKIIMISGHNNPELKKEAKKAGAYAFLPKPIDLETLFKMLDHIIVNHYIFSPFKSLNSFPSTYKRFSCQ